jgi:rubrerythrin
MELLDFALQMEQQGFEYYKTAADKVKDCAARDMLLSLADDEKKHAQVITQIKQGEHGEKKGPPLVGVRNVFQQLVEEGRDFGAEDHLIRVCNEALDVEKKSVDMYQQLADQSDDPEHQKLWLILKSEEEKHVKLLRLTADFAHQPGMVMEDAEFLFYGDDFQAESG